MGQRDVTPEATKEVIERECPGIVTAILMRGLQVPQNLIKTIEIKLLLGIGLKTPEASIYSSHNYGKRTI